MGINPTRIRQARLAAGLSQDGLAYKARTSARNIARWEKGDHVPRVEAVAAIAAATGQDVAYFFTDGDESDEEAALDARLLVALRDWRGAVDPNQRRDLTAQIGKEGT